MQRNKVLVGVIVVLVILNIVSLSFIWTEQDHQEEKKSPRVERYLGKRLKLDEEQVTWNEFQKHFKDKYLTECYYDEKAKEFHELRLGTLTMDEYVTRFMSLLCYVPYMQEKKAKIQHFISSLPNFTKEKMEFDYPKTMDDVVHKARICY